MLSVDYLLVRGNGKSFVVFFFNNLIIHNNPLHSRNLKYDPLNISLTVLLKWLTLFLKCGRGCIDQYTYLCEVCSPSQRQVLQPYELRKYFPSCQVCKKVIFSLRVKYFFLLNFSFYINDRCLDLERAYNSFILIFSLSKVKVKIYSFYVM